MKNLMIAITALFASFLLTGCPKHCEGPTCDTDNHPDAFGAIVATVEVDGVDIDTDVEAVSETNPDEAYAGMTGEPLEVPAGSWKVQGGSGPPTADSLPTLEVDGLPWVTPPINMVVVEDSEKSVGLVANRYFENSSLVCHADVNDWNEGHIFVTEGHKLVLPKTVGDTSWLEVEVDQLVLAGAKASAGMSITSSSIGLDTLSFTIDTGSFTVDYTCD
ncbi:MAG: hypothetical protein ABH826_04535 [Patescibacteria group bacterium]